MSDPSHITAADLSAVVDRNGQPLTALRQRVLEIVVAHDRPIGAYDVLAELAKERGKVAPPTAYRALDYLLKEGLIHRIHSMNAYVACICTDKAQTATMLICRDCGSTSEVSSSWFRNRVREEAKNHDFWPESVVVEVQGLCSDCHEQTT